MKAFISHSFEDAEKFQDFSDIFTREAIPLFRPLDMNGTRSLADQLREAIADCDVCIFLATHNSVHSNWCGAELGAFWGTGKAVIIYVADSNLDLATLPQQFQGQGGKVRCRAQSLQPCPRTNTDRHTSSRLG